MEAFQKNRRKALEIVDPILQLLYLIQAHMEQKAFLDLFGNVRFVRNPGGRIEIFVPE
jgi:hypothetical protein